MNPILLVCAQEKSAKILENTLSSFLNPTIISVSSVAQARKALESSSFGLIMVNLPLPDEDGEGFAKQAAQSTSSGILLLCAKENAEQTLLRCAPQGILVIPKPIVRAAFVQAVYLGLSTGARLADLLQENRQLHSKIEELKLVSRAKAVLIEYLKLTEPQAHRYIEKQAMDLGIHKQEVALNILKTYES